MEPRAHHLIIGLFTILAFAAAATAAAMTAIYRDALDPRQDAA